MDNGTLLHAMFDIVEREIAGLPRDEPEESTACSMMRNSGKISLWLVSCLRMKVLAFIYNAV